MKNSQHKTMKSFLTVCSLFFFSMTANAKIIVPAVDVVNTWDNDNHIMTAGQSISASNEGVDKQSFTSNPDLDGASWGHFGNWYTFMTHEDSAIKISVTATKPQEMSPGFSVWRTDGEFDGGTPKTGEQSTVEVGTPHSFNSIGKAGNYGTWWMTDNSVSITDPNTNGGVGFAEHGIVEHLGYASDGIYEGSNGWGEIVKNDGNQDGYAELTFDNMDAGWYLIFVGGADGTVAGSGAPLNIQVDSSPIVGANPVPVPAAVWLFGSSLAGLFLSRKKA